MPNGEPGQRMPRADRGGSSPTSFILREAMVLDAGGGFSGPADIAVDGGVVVTVGRTLRLNAPSYDFRGLWLLPGMVDCHLHAIATSLDTMTLLRMPLSERILEATSVLKRCRRGAEFDPGPAGLGPKDTPRRNKSSLAGKRVLKGRVIHNSQLARRDAQRPCPGGHCLDLVSRAGVAAFGAS